MIDPTSSGTGAVATASGLARYTFDQLKALWVQAGGNPAAAPMAAAVALAESGGNPASTNTNGNGTIDRGLWQINSTHGNLSTLDPVANARAAVQLSNNGTTWRPWCSAWSDNRCGGTFLGEGANIYRYLPSGSGTGLSPTGNSGTATSGTPVSLPGFSALDPRTWANAFLSPIFKSAWYGFNATLGALLIGIGIWLLIVHSGYGQAVSGALRRRIGVPGAESESQPEEVEDGN